VQGFSFYKCFKFLHFPVFHAGKPDFKRSGVSPSKKNHVPASRLLLPFFLSGQIPFRPTLLYSYR
jgi:hypothetical protein